MAFFCFLFQVIRCDVDRKGYIECANKVAL